MCVVRSKHLMIGSVCFFTHKAGSALNKAVLENGKVKHDGTRSRPVSVWGKGPMIVSC